MTEGRDWFAIVGGSGPCPDCRFDAAAWPRDTLAAVVMGEARAWEDLLVSRRGDDDSFRRRPDPDTWSAVEYASHVAGVFAVFAERVALIRADDGAELGWWDHEAAVTEERYAERTAEDVRARIADGAVALALSLPRNDDDAGWARAGIRRSGERFTVEGLARFVLHESAHHRHDARRSWVSGNHG